MAIAVSIRAQNQLIFQNKYFCVTQTTRSRHADIYKFTYSDACKFSNPKSLWSKSLASGKCMRRMMIHFRWTVDSIYSYMLMNNPCNASQSFTVLILSLLMLGCVISFWYVAREFPWLLSSTVHYFNTFIIRSVSFIRTGSNKSDFTERTSSNRKSHISSTHIPKCQVIKDVKKLNTYQSN